MMKLQHVKFNGFKLGVRVADSYTLTARINDPLARAGLHAIKGIAHQLMLAREAKIMGINGGVYAVSI